MDTKSGGCDAFTHRMRIDAGETSTRYRENIYAAFETVIKRKSTRIDGGRKHGEFEASCMAESGGEERKETSLTE